MSRLPINLIKGQGVKRPVSSQFIRYCAVGVVGTATHFAVLILMVQWAKANPVLGSGAGFVAACLVNYRLNYQLTFRSSKPHRTAFCKFFTVALVGLSLNTLIMAVSLQWLNYLVCQAIASCLVLVWNFNCNRFWTFREAVEN